MAPVILAMYGFTYSIDNPSEGLIVFLFLLLIRQRLLLAGSLFFHNDVFIVDKLSFISNNAFGIVAYGGGLLKVLAFWVVVLESIVRVSVLKAPRED